MGLASALTTALTGMTAAETQIDVAGNNLANSQTVGFKSSSSVFATQFLQTQGLGSSPTTSSGGTNPRQTGLGVRVAEITPDFTQGTIEISSNPSDLAIQGDGFFMVQGSTGETLYTRNGIFKLNSQNELVNVTGQKVLGFGIDDSFDIQETTLEPLSIPLGSAAVAQATQNVYLQGVLTPSGDVADTAQVIESAIMGDSIVAQPSVTGVTRGISPTIGNSGATAAHTQGTGTHAEGAVYKYRFTYVDDSGTESLPSNELSVTVPVGDGLANNTITLNGLPAAAGYANVKIYRTDAGGSDFKFLATAATGGSYADTNATALSTQALDTTSINGNYTYVVTYYRAGEEESRPSTTIGPVNVVNGRVHLTDMPTPPPAPSDGSFPAYDRVRIYRNLSTDSTAFYLVGEVAPGQDFTDSRTDADISNLAVSTNKQVDLDGPKVDTNTLLVNVIKRDGFTYDNLFKLGTLEFTGRKGGRTLTAQTFEVTSTSTVRDLMAFMQQATGIQTSLDDPQNLFPGSVNNIPGETGTLPPGITVTNGKLRIVSNNGVDNAIEIGISGMKLTATDNTVTTPSMSFGQVQVAKGQSAVADFIAYDTLGIPLNVRVTTVLQSVSDSATTYRWYADSGSNQPANGNDISVGTGLITFDGEGNLINVTNDRVSVGRRDVPANDPLDFRLDFSSVVGLAESKSSLAASRQDGSAAGTLTSYIIGEDGKIVGVFSNGASRDLGQIRLARFSNPSGLEQIGQNLFSQGVNSGLPVEGNPGDYGIGSLVSGAQELSNTDIGRNLIDLVLATTQYRGNARVITAAQELLDELLNIRR